MKCKICGAEYSEDVSVCKFCGNNMENEGIDSYYKRLGGSAKRNNRPNILYCTNCGKTLNMETFKCDTCDAPAIIEKPKIEPPNPVKRERPKPIKSSEPERKAYNDEVIDYRKTYYSGDGLRSDMKKNKNKVSTKKIVLSVLGLMLLFAISVTAFYFIISKTLNKDKQPIPTANPTAVAEISPTEVPTEKAESTVKPVKRTEKPTEKASKATEKPTDKPTNKPSESMSKSLYPTDKRIITQKELEALSREEIKLIYYEIYARHGMTFDDDFLIEYFENRKGYVPTETDEEEVEAKFNDKERENIKVIEEYQIEQGWRSN